MTNQMYVTLESARIGRDGVLVDGFAAAPKGIQDCIVGLWLRRYGGCGGRDVVAGKR